MLRWLTVAFSLLVLATPAMAHPRHRRAWVAPPRPTVVVRVNPWVSYYRPDPRPGWHWVGGRYARWGAWVPGYWEPDVAQAGYVWVPGHWVGATYVDGYWREPERAGWVWVDGEYDETGTWIPGYWAPEGSVREEEPPMEVHHEYE